MALREDLIRVAHANPGPVRDVLLPLLKEAAGRPPKALLERAVKEMQLYMGSQNYASIRQQEKLYARFTKSANQIAGATGMLLADVWRQLEAEARKRGAIRPQPGKDI